MERNKTLDIIIAVVIAIVLWFYIIAVVNPPISRTIKTVPVSITGEEHLAERGFAIAAKQSYYVDIRVSGLRNEVTGLNVSDFAASSDVSELQDGDRNMTVNVTGPRSITVEEISTPRIMIRVDKLVRAEKSVNILYAEGDAGELTIMNAPETVTVKGAESDVAKVSRVDFTIDAAKLNLDEQKILNITGVIRDEDGEELKNVSLENETSPFDVALYETKTVALDIVLEGMAKYGESSIESIEHTPAVKIKGPASIVSGISGITETLDVTGLEEDTERALEIHLPKGVYLSRSSESVKVKITISEDAKAEYEAALNADNEIDNTSDQKEGN